MTSVSISPMVAADCADQLSRLAAALSRDATTLVRIATSLVISEQYGRPLGILKKYARENHQYGSAEVEKVIFVMEAVMDPEHKKHLARLQKKRDKDRAAFKERCSEPRPAEAWAAPPLWERTTGQEKAARPRQNGNVIDGPWPTGGEARPS